MSKNSNTTLAVAEKPEKSESKIVPLQVREGEKQAELKSLPIEDLKNRAIALALLNQKHDGLTEKRKRLERFAIVHEHDNAQIRVTDANGEEFVSCSPKSIARLIDFWKEEFREAIEESETQIKAMFA
jgi:hypothetical protein